MAYNVKKLSLGIAACMLLALIVSGCNTSPMDKPAGQRAPGQDITPQARADKRGDVPVTPTSK